MKILRWTMVALAGSSMLYACTVKNASADDDNGTGTTTTTTTTSGAGGGSITAGSSTTTTTSTGSSMMDCSTSNISGDTACEPCIQQNCCNQIKAVEANPGDAAASQALQTCAQGATCALECQYVICESEKAIFVFKSVADCINTNCCDSFTACDADADCANCLTGSGTGCDTNTLFTTYQQCAATDNNCFGGG